MSVNFFDLVVTLVKEKIEEEGGTNPLIFVRTMDQETLAIDATPLGNKEEKAQFYNFIKLLFAILHVYEYVIATEAWTVRTNKEDKLQCQPSEHPDKREIVIFTYVSRDKQDIKWYNTCVVDGKKLLTIDESLKEGTKWSGDFFDLLSLDPVPEKEAIKLRQKLGGLGVKSYGKIH